MADTEQKLIPGGITIGVPCRGSVSPTWAYQFRMMEIPFETYQILMPQGMNVDEARNYIVDHAKGEWIFFLDSDTVPPLDVIRRLHSHGKQLISGLYFQRKSPFYPQIYKKSDVPGRWDAKVYYEKDKLIEIDSAGMGCCLIHRDVFDTIGTKDAAHPKPWFYFTGGYGEAQRESEDHYFFRRCAEEKIQAYCDTSVACGHIGQEVITELHWEAMRGDMFETNKPRV